ncbi:MAG: TMEM165/GDT1 family protein [Sphingopyxis sp.]|nr:TMEM165/GDT1 family protein [Sphingopyxis sp.]
MEAFLASTLLVTLAEIGDKTQLLAIVLAAQFNRPLLIIAGIAAATLANHALAAWVGTLAAGWLDGPEFRLALAAGFVVMAAWTLIPDKLDDDDAPETSVRGAFLTTLIAFFLVEMGDKTQIATVALGAQYQQLLWVTAGTTLGMLIANVPAVLLGQALVKRVPLATMRRVAAGLFLLTGLWFGADALGWVP